MRILIDIGHPGHVHFFKHLHDRLCFNGHDLIVTLRSKEMAAVLLNYYRIKYSPTVGHAKNAFGKFLINLKRAYILFEIMRRNRIDISLGIADYPLAWAAKMLGSKSLIFTDTEHVGIDRYLTFPFADSVVTPSCYYDKVGEKQIEYDGYHELAYLHPNYFRPDRSVLKLLGLTLGEKYVIVRFVSWTASHDMGHSGIGLEMKRRAVKEFSKYARVFISSEKSLPDDLLPYKSPIRPEMMHSAQYYAALLYGESATMASECAVLGTPAIFVDNEGRGYTDEEEERYGMVFNFTESLEDQERSIIKGVGLLNTPNVKEDWQKKRTNLLSKTIDVTAFMVWLIENYPDSVKIMKENPKYQLRFK